MSDITLTVDVPKRTVAIPRMNRWNALKDEVRKRHGIDLTYYDVETESQSISYPVRSQQDYEIVLSKGRVHLLAKLQDYSKPTCAVCNRSFTNKRTFEDHFKECTPPSVGEERRPSGTRDTAVGRPSALNLLIQKKGAGLHSLLSAMAACPQICSQLKNMHPPADNPLLQALQSDMAAFSQQRPLQLLPLLTDDRGKSALLALDAFNLLSLELIQNQDCYATEPLVLESVFLKRRQLCIDIQTSSLREQASLSAVLATYDIESLPAEFPIALLWDEGPIASFICDVMLKLTGEILVTLPEETCRLRLSSLTLSKGILALSVTPGSAGRLCLNSEESTIEMKPEELILFASQWEIKPELAFFAKAGPVIFPAFSPSVKDDIENQVKATELIALEAPVPSIVMSGDEATDSYPPVYDGWQCAQCGEFNENEREMCRKCGMQVLDVGDSKQMAPERVQEIVERDSEKSKWKCRYCTFGNPKEAQICQQCSKSNIPPEPAEPQPTGWVCEHCTLVNSDSDRICAACARTRKDLLTADAQGKREIDKYWKCANCGYAANGPTDTRCFKCREAKKIAADAGDTRKKEENDWICPVCEKENYFFSLSCRSCKAPKPADTIPRPEEIQRENPRVPLRTAEPPKTDMWRCERCDVDVEANRSYCSVCYARKPSKMDLNLPKPSPVSEEWKCGECQHVNRPTRDVCLICRRPRAAPEETPKPTASGWVCKQCGQANSEKETLCLGCLERNPSLPDEPPKSKYNNWECGKCGGSNPYYEVSCMRCGEGKEKKQPLVTADTGRSEQKRRGSDQASAEFKEDYFAAEVPVRAPVPSKAQVPRLAYDLDLGSDVRAAAGRKPVAEPVMSTYWNCASCSAMNLASDMDCYRCHKPKTVGSLEGNVPAREAEGRPRVSNYWKCPGCGVQNYKDDLKCYKCKLDKDGGAAPPAAAAGKWTCENCQAINREEATYCGKCFRDKQSPPKQSAERQTRVKAGWLCKYCQTENAVAEDRCVNCHRSAPRKAEPEPRRKVCSSCGQPTTKDSQLCNLCEREAKYRSPKSWTCQKCRIAVSGNYCSRCYSSKPRT